MYVPWDASGRKLIASTTLYFKEGANLDRSGFTSLVLYWWHMPKLFKITVTFKNPSSNQNYEIKTKVAMVKYLLSLTQANEINLNQKFNQRIWKFCRDLFTLKSILTIHIQYSCNMPNFWYFSFQSQLHFRSIVRDGMALNLYIGAWKDAFKERTKKARRNIYVAHNITICHIVREIFQNEIA